MVLLKIWGLQKVQSNETVEFASGVRGMVMNLWSDRVGVVIFGDDRLIKQGDVVKRTGHVMSVPTGPGLVGRVVDAMGRPIDGEGSLNDVHSSAIERPAPGIMERQSVHQPLQTGIKVIDALIPIGRGQRELIVGDRQIGKTTIAVDTILNQKSENEKNPNKKGRLHLCCHWTKALVSCANRQYFEEKWGHVLFGGCSSNSVRSCATAVFGPLYGVCHWGILSRQWTGCYHYL